MSYSNIVNEISKELGLTVDLVDRSYRAYWLFIREHIKSLPLKEIQSEEEFSKLKTNINIPSLGKLSCTYDRLLRVKKRYELIKKIRNA